AGGNRARRGAAGCIRGAGVRRLGGRTARARDARQRLAHAADKRSAGLRSALRGALAGSLAAARRGQLARQPHGGPCLSGAAASPSASTSVLVASASPLATP